jgi:hypothetical protein
MQYFHCLMPFIDVDCRSSFKLSMGKVGYARWLVVWPHIRPHGSLFNTWQSTMTCMCNRVGLVVHPLSPKVCADKTMLIWTRRFWATPWFVSTKMNKRPLIGQNARPSRSGTPFKLKHCNILNYPNQPWWNWLLVNFSNSLVSWNGAMDPSLGIQFH